MRQHFTCSNCGVDFERWPSQVRGASVCCSLACTTACRRKPGGFEILADGVTAAIPLHDRAGTVTAFALIDVADAETVGKWRWSLDHQGYVMRRENGKRVDLHRELLGLKRGDGIDGDHRDRDTLNNRRSNLRRVTRPQNGQNKPSYAGSRSVYRGVTWHKGSRKWQAQVKTNGKNMKLGVFDSEIEAAEAARAGRARYLPYAVD